MPPVAKEDRKNAFLYCKFRDEQFALYDEYAKKNGLSMKTFLVLNLLFYAEDGLTQKQLCQRTFQSKQTVNVIIKKLLAQGYAAPAGTGPRRGRAVQLTAAGRAYAEAPVRHITHAEDAAMALFTPEEQAQLVALSRRFTENLTMLVQKEEEL